MNSNLNMEPNMNSLHVDTIKECAERLKNNPDEADDLLRIWDKNTQYEIFESYHHELPIDIVDKIILGQPRRSQVKALKVLSDFERHTALKVFECILRGQDRESLEPGKIFTEKIVEAVLRGYVELRENNEVKLHFSNRFKKWFDMDDLLRKLEEFSKEQTDNVILAPVLFSVLECSENKEQWHLLIYKMKESLLCYFHFNESFNWQPRDLKEVKLHHRCTRIEKSYKSGLYVVQWAQFLIDNPDCDIRSVSENSLTLTKKDVITFLRLDGNFYCHNQYCHKPFDTKSDRRKHEKKCKFAVENGRTVLFSCDVKKLPEMKKLLQRIPKPERDIFIMTKDHHGKTALHECNNEEVASFLVNSLGKEHRYNFIMIKDHNGKTALAECQNQKMAKRLREYLSKEQRNNFDEMARPPQEISSELLVNPTNVVMKYRETPNNRDETKRKGFNKPDNSEFSRLFQSAEEFVRSIISHNVQAGTDYPDIAAPCRNNSPVYNLSKKCFSETLNTPNVDKRNEIHVAGYITTSCKSTLYCQDFLCSRPVNLVEKCS